MKVKDLISSLSKYDGDLEVTTSDNHGLFSSIGDVIMQRWSDDSFASVTLVLCRYDNSKCIVDDEKITENRADNEFLDNVNNQSEYKIDKKESLGLKALFTGDLEEYRSEIEKTVEKRYTKVLMDSMDELFGFRKTLEELSLGELKDCLKEVGFNDELNDRYTITMILYSKLNERIKKKLLEDGLDLKF